MDELRKYEALAWYGVLLWMTTVADIVADPTLQQDNRFGRMVTEIAFMHGILLATNSDRLSIGNGKSRREKEMDATAQPRTARSAHGKARWLALVG